MKCAVSMWSVHKYYFAKEMDVCDFLKYAAEQSWEGVELLDVFWRDKDKELPEVDRLLAESGLKVACYSASNNFVQPDQAQRQEEVQKIKRAVDMAEHFAAPVVRVFSGDAAEGIEFDQAREWILAGLREAAAYAEKHNVKLALENHGLFAGKSLQVEEIVKAVASPALGSTFDTGNFLLVDDRPEEAIDRLAPYVFHVHFKDFRQVPADFPEHAYQGVSGLKFAGTVTGEGQVDLGAILRRLAAEGYDGWLAIEYEGNDEPKAGTERSMANLKRSLAEL